MKKMLPYQVLAVAVVLLALATPRAAHAVAAALVQVTNTTANPVVNLGLNHQASQIIDVSCVTYQTTIIPCTANGSQYAVPAGQSFVITSIDLVQFSACNPAFFSLWVDSFEQTQLRLFVLNGQTSVHYSYPAGIVIPSGAGVGAQSQGGSCNEGVHINGYLTAI